MDHTILWTSLPAGYQQRNKTIRFTVHVAPQLGDVALADFVKWPSVVERIRFAAHFEESGQIITFAESDPRMKLHRVGTAPLAEVKNVWQAIFGELKGSQTRQGQQ